MSLEWVDVALNWIIVNFKSGLSIDRLVTQLPVLICKLKAQRGILKPSKTQDTFKVVIIVSSMLCFLIHQVLWKIDKKNWQINQKEQGEKNNEI